MIEFIGSERAAESRNNRGGLHAASCESQGIYLPYICHVPNCITRYVGFLYKTALRSPSTSLSSFNLPRRAPVFPDLSLSPIIISLSRAHKNTLDLHSRHMARGPCCSFIIHTVLKVEHLVHRPRRTLGQSVAKTALFTVGKFFKISPKAWRGAFVSHRKIARKVNASERERERGERMKVRAKDDKKIWKQILSSRFSRKCLQTLTRRNVKAYAFFSRVISTLTLRRFL